MSEQLPRKRLAELRAIVVAAPGLEKTEPGSPLTQRRHERSQAAERIIQMVKDRQVLTVGHSSHPWEEFREMLRRHKITDLVDVRSSPFSRFAPWAKKDFLAPNLPALAVAYHWWGAELGGQPAGERLYDPEGRLIPELVRQTDFYRRGLARLLALTAQRGRVCIMCAEANPEVCHRKTLIAADLIAAGIRVSHIRPPIPD